MENVKFLRELTNEEMVYLDGGKPFTKESNWGEDIGAIVGFIIGALCKGASYIKG